MHKKNAVFSQKNAAFFQKTANFFQKDGDFFQKDGVFLDKMNTLEINSLQRQILFEKATSRLPTFHSSCCLVVLSLRVL